jgi:hypothetical protein
VKETSRHRASSAPPLRIGNYLGRRCIGWRTSEGNVMGFGRGFLLWIIGIPLPIILLLALFWHN